jgi:WD40 repeat protein
MRFSYGTVPLYGVAWSPTHHTILAAGSHDGKILVFNSALSQRHLIHELYGNAAKVFTVAWSVLNRGLIAGASDDAVCYLCCRCCVGCVDSRFCGYYELIKIYCQH